MKCYVVTSETDNPRVYTSKKRANAVARAKLLDFLEEYGARIENEGKDRNGCFYGDAIYDEDSWKEWQIVTESVNVKETEVVLSDEEDSVREEYTEDEAIDGEEGEESEKPSKEKNTAACEGKGQVGDVKKGQDTGKEEVEDVAEEEFREAKRRRT